MSFIPLMRKNDNIKQAFYSNEPHLTPTVLSGIETSAIMHIPVECFPNKGCGCIPKIKAFKAIKCNFAENEEIVP